MKKQAGFTLIELMITVAIVAILAAIAIPSYEYALIKARRADAMGALVGFSSAMERSYTENNNYCNVGGAGGTDTCGDGGNDTGTPSNYSAVSPVDGGTSYYNLTIETLSPTSFTLRATPIANTSQDGDGFIELDNTDARGWDADDSGTIADPAEKKW